MNMQSFEPAAAMFEIAMAKYNDRFRRELYAAATFRANIARCAKLIDSAMAVCGSPYHALVAGDWWSQDEIAFLTAFLDQPPAKAQAFQFYDSAGRAYGLSARKVAQMVRKHGLTTRRIYRNLAVESSEWEALMEKEGIPMLPNYKKATPRPASRIFETGPADTYTREDEGDPWQLETEAIANRGADQ